MPVLFHFTCAHGHAGIGRRGLLLPNAHPLILEPLVWMTSAPMPDREASGLAAVRTTCDRMQYRYVVTDTEHCVPWVDSWVRHDTRRRVVQLLEEYGDVHHWWVSTHPVPARLG